MGPLLDLFNVLYDEPWCLCMQEVVHVISDAYVLSEMDDAAAAAAMAGTHRGITDANKAVERLRSTCLSMLCAAMQWDLFRYHVISSM